MRISGELLPISAVRRDFDKWCKMVCGCLQGGAPAKRHSGSQYAELHSRLIKQCYLHVQSDKATERQLFQQLLSLLDPWQSLEILHHTPPHVLAGLVQQCRALTQDFRQLPGQRRLLPNGWILVGLVLLVIGIGILYATTHAFDGLSMGLWAECRLAFLRLKIKVLRLSLSEKSALVALAAVAVGGWMIRTSNRG